MKWFPKKSQQKVEEEERAAYELFLRFVKGEADLYFTEGGEVAVIPK